MEKPSNSNPFQSAARHRNPIAADDKPISHNHPMKQNNKNPLSLSPAGECKSDGKTNLSITCNLSPSQTSRITESFVNSLIAHVIGRNITAQFLADRLRRVFHLTGTLTVTELGRGYFVINFSQSLDCSKVLENRPWSIPNLCISFSQWIPNFKPSEAEINDFEIWVRLIELSIEYYDMEVLKQIAECIGILVKIDPVTELRKKCNFARFCVRVSSKNPLPSEIIIGEIRLKIEYEGLYNLCSGCRCIDDLKQSCLNSTDRSGFGLEHRGFSYRHPNCRTDGESGSNSKQPTPPCLGSRFQILGELNEEPSLPLGECASTSCSLPVPSVNVAPPPKFVKKKNYFPGLKVESASDFNLGNQNEISRAYEQKPSHNHHMSSASKVEASSRLTTNAPELKENDLIQSMPLAPSIVETQFSDLQFDQQNVSIPYPSPQSPPISVAAIDFFSSGTLRSTMKKEIRSMPSTEVSDKCCPTVFIFDSMFTNIVMGLSDAMMSNQYVTHFVSTTQGGNDYGIGTGPKSGSCSNKLLCWYYRGTDSIKLMRALKDLIQLHEPSVVLIFGTKISGDDADQVVKELAFHGSYCKKPNGNNGGIWLLLSRQDIRIEVNSYSSQQISASVCFHSGTNKRMLDVIDADTETSSQPWGPNFFYSSSNLIDNALAY